MFEAAQLALDDWKQHRFPVVLCVNVVRARGLRNADEDGISDPMVEISFASTRILEEQEQQNIDQLMLAEYAVYGGDVPLFPVYPITQRTHNKKDQANPQWNEDLYFIVNEYAKSVTMRATAYHSGSVDPVSLGFAQMTVDIEQKTTKGSPKKRGGWYILEEGEGGRLEVRWQMMRYGDSFHEGLLNLHRRRIEYLLEVSRRYVDFRPPSIENLRSHSALLVFELYQGRDLRNEDVQVIAGVSDPFVEVQVTHDGDGRVYPKKQRSHFIIDSLNPNWNCRMMFLMMKDDSMTKLKLSVFDFDTVAEADPLGSTVLDLGQEAIELKENSKTQDTEIARARSDTMTLAAQVELLSDKAEIFQEMRTRRRWKKLTGTNSDNGVIYYGFYKIPCDSIFKLSADSRFDAPKLW